MGASSKAEVMKRYVEAWERNDWEAATAIWADNVIHHVPGRGPLAGDFHDKQALLDHYGLGTSPYLRVLGDGGCC